jgi:hypothetical protein
MSLTKTVEFPDGTIARSDEKPRHLWVVAASPLSEARIREIDAAWHIALRGKIELLESAIANPVVEIEPTAANADPHAPVLRNARLANSPLSTVVDKDNEVVDLGSTANADKVLFPKSGESLEAVLLAQANAHMTELLRSEEASLASANSNLPDSRSAWHVVRWIAKEDRARKFAQQMNSLRPINEQVIVLLASASA